MSLFTFTSALLTAAVAITSVQASPFSGLDTRSFNGLLARDLSGKICKPFVYGAKRTPVGGDVCVSFAGDSLTVTYPDLSSVGGSYGDLHVIIRPTRFDITAPGQWPYKLDNGYCTKSGTCTIPILDTWRACGLDLYIGIHAAFIPKTGSASETGYANGDCIDPKNSGNCAKYFVFKTECQCVEVTKYEEVKTSVRVFSRKQCDIC